MKAVVTSIEPPMVSITVQKHPDMTSLQKRVSEAGDFIILEQTKDNENHHLHSPHGNDLNIKDESVHSTHRNDVHSSETDHGNMKHDPVPSPTLDNKKAAANVSMDHSKMKMEQGGHAAHGGHNHAAMITDFKRRFFVVLVLTMPIILLSPMIQQWLGVQWQFLGSMYLLFGLSTIVFFYGGWPFLKGWFEEMKTWKPGMMI